MSGQGQDRGWGGLGGARQTGESLAEGSPAWESPLRPEASARRRCLKFGAKGVCSQGRNPGPPRPPRTQGVVLGLQRGSRPDSQHSCRVPASNVRTPTCHPPDKRSGAAPHSRQPQNGAVLPASPALGGSQGPAHCVPSDCSRHRVSPGPGSAGRPAAGAARENPCPCNREHTASLSLARADRCPASSPARRPSVSPSHRRGPARPFSVTALSVKEPRGPTSSVLEKKKAGLLSP